MQMRLAQGKPATLLHKLLPTFSSSSPAEQVATPQAAVIYRCTINGQNAHTNDEFSYPYYR
jgi:hypothetical protein